MATLTKIECSPSHKRQSIRRLMRGVAPLIKGADGMCIVVIKDGVYDAFWSHMDQSVASFAGECLKRRAMRVATGEEEGDCG
jgi:hypothetical protein